jgi:2,4-dienoyl-CoA reductase-like NADH-dependent reductase (Old Yellow Enzyme family)
VLNYPELQPRLPTFRSSLTRFHLNYVTMREHTSSAWIQLTHWGARSKASDNLLLPAPGRQEHYGTTPVVRNMFRAVVLGRNALQHNTGSVLL